MTEVKERRPDDGWKWWAGDSGEWYTSGPHDTRDEAISCATGECRGEFQDGEDGNKWKLGFHVVEARQDPLRLADWIRADSLLEIADEEVGEHDRAGEYVGGAWFNTTPEQDADLVARIKRACDEWQAAHNLVFSARTFSNSRADEFVVVDHPNGYTP